jgi:thioester reductase-like protein
MPWRKLLDTAQRASSCARDSFLAVEDDQLTLTLDELHESASWVARSIAGVARDSNEVCALFVEKDATSVVASLASLMAGVPFVDAAASRNPSEIARILGVVQPTIALVTAKTREWLPAGLADTMHIFDLDGHPHSKEVKEGSVTSCSVTPVSPLLPTLPFLPKAGDEGFGWCDRTVKDGAFCVFTSGTTSLSKIVMCPHAGLTGGLQIYSADTSPGDRIAVFWVYYSFLSIICLNATCVLLPNTIFMDPSALVAAVRTRRITGLYITPSILNACLCGLPEAQIAADFGALRVIWLTGEAVTPKMRLQVRRTLPHVRLRNILSTNETGHLAISDTDHVYQMLDSVSFEVRDPATLDLVSEGGVGALFVRSTTLFKGYWTAEGISFVAGPNERYRTGDLVKYLGGRSVSFVSREVSSHIKVRGFKVFPELVEKEIMKHPDVDAAWCAAVGRGDDGDDTTSRFEAAVGLSVGSTLTARELRAFVADHVPSHMVPVVFRSLGSGSSRWTAKSGKRPLPTELSEILSQLPILEGATQREHLPPGAAQLAQLWTRVLQLPYSTSIPSDANFFDFGGSLAFFQLTKEIAAAYGVELPIGTLLQSPTLVAMARVVFTAEQPPRATDEEQPTVTGASVFDAVAAAREFPLLTDQLKMQPQEASTLHAATISSYLQLPCKTILVTGGTGYVGTFLMGSLARRPDVSRVLVLVRSTDAATAGERLRAACVNRAMDEVDGFDAWFAKVTPLSGDFVEARLGLSEPAYAQLASSVDGIIHAGAEVNMLKSYAALAHCNVGGTAHVLAFAKHARAPLLFTSTMQPAGTEGTPPITGYQQSKAAAEQLCLEARMSHGVPSAVLQLGDIGFGTGTSAKALSPDDYIVAVLGACVAVNCFPLRPDWSVSIMAVDACCNLLTETILTAPLAMFDGVGHEVKSDLTPWLTLCGWLQASLPSLQGVPFDEWKVAISRVASADEAGTAAPKEKAATIALATRALMLLPAIEREFTAEDESRKRGKGAEGTLVLDQAWGKRFGIALSSLVLDDELGVEEMR